MNHKKPVAIIGAMQQEITTLIEQIINCETTEVAGMQLYSGLLQGVPVVIMLCGIGKVNATIATTLLIERFTPCAIINTGSAGGINTQLAIGDVVIGDNVSHHDVDVRAFGYEMGQMAQMPATYPCDNRLVEYAQKGSKAFPNATVHRGQIVSGDQFIHSHEKFATIKKHFPNAFAVEMEACAIAQTCYRFNIPFVVIRAISDLANEKATLSFEEFIEQAGKHSAKMVKRILQEFES